MANAGLLVVNDADTGFISASSQVLTMPAAKMTTPHPSERWRSNSNNDYVVVDKLRVKTGNTFMAKGLTCGPNSTVRLRLSANDQSVAVGEVFDSGVIASGSQSFDVAYGACVWAFPNAMSWRWSRLDIHDPDSTFVEVGSVIDGLRTDFEFNFALSSTVQYIDRSRVAQSSAGLTLTWEDNNYRRLNLNFERITEEERYGIIELMDRVKGIHRNVLMITDTTNENLPRSAFFGLVTDLTPVTFAVFTDLLHYFGKQFRIDERI